MKSLLFALITICVGLNAWGTDYYVSSVKPARNDSNPGTNPSAPWATMTKVRAAWGSLAAGDTVHMDRGSEWDESFTGDWVISHGGSAGLPITLRGDDYGSGASPIMKHTAGGVACGYIAIQTSYVTIRDFVVDGGNSDYGQNTGGISIYPIVPISNVQILNMRIKNLGGTTLIYTCGIWIGGGGAPYGADSCLIQGNYVSDYSAHGLNHYCPYPLTNITWRNNIVINSYAGGRFPGANSAMQVSTSGGGGNIIEYNFLQDTTTTEAGIFGFGKYASDTSASQIRFNVIANSNAYGILFANDQSGKTLLYDIYGNVIYNSANSGLAIHPSDSYAAGTRFNVFNNTFFHNYTIGGDSTHGELELRQECLNTAVNVVNNLFSHGTAGTTVALAVNSGFNGNLTHSNNLYWHEGGATMTVISAGGTFFSVTNALFYEATAQNTSPQFVDPAHPPGHVSSSGGATPLGLLVLPSSPAIGAGTDLGSAYALDIQSTFRSSGKWSIGAYQVDPTPLSPPARIRLAP